MSRTDAGRLMAEQRWEHRVQRSQRHDRAARRERSAIRDLECEGRLVELARRPRVRHTDVRGVAA